MSTLRILSVENPKMWFEFEDLRMFKFFVEVLNCRSGVDDSGEVVQISEDGKIVLQIIK